MTHTFKKEKPGRYHVGMWLQMSVSQQIFQALVTVTTLRAAIRLVNLLNGGHGGVDAMLLRTGVMSEEDQDAAAKPSAPASH